MTKEILMKLMSIVILSLFIFSCASQKTTEREPAQESIINSLSGATAIVSVDWKRTWEGLSGKTRRDRKEANTYFCRQLYSDVVKNRALVQDLFEKREINSEQRDIFFGTSENMEKSADDLCIQFVGKKKSEKIKNEIMGAQSED
jgi:hypothetical protein